MSIYIRLFIASLFWGSNVVLMKVILDGFPFLLLAWLRIFISMMCLFTYMLIKKVSFRLEYFYQAIWVGIIGIYGNLYFTFLAMGKLKGVENAFMNALSPVIVFVVSLFTGYRPLRHDWFCMSLALLAFFMSVKFKLFNIQQGFYLMMIAMILYSIANVLIEKWHCHMTYTFIFYELLIGSLCLFVHCIISGKWQWQYLMELSPMNWVGLIVISGIGFAYIQATYMEGIEKIGALKTSFFLGINPMITYLESWLFLQEKIDMIHLFSFALLMFSMFLYFWFNKRTQMSS